MPDSDPTDPAERTAFRPDPAVVIGLLGGIAAGKTAVAAAFAARGLAHLDADRVGREVADQPDVRRAVAAALGSGVLDRDGRLDRRVLAEKVFSDPEQRRKLEQILHPRIRRELLRALDEARRGGTSVLLDVPLLLENGLIDRCDHVVFVAASREVRAARAALRGWAPGELARREAAQADLDQKRGRAHFVVDNDGPLDRLPPQVDAILNRIAGTGS